MYMIHNAGTYRTREELNDILRETAEEDGDFNGGNGPDYLYDEAKEAGFSSNLEYAIAKHSHIENDVDYVDAFVDTWVTHDNYYEAPDIIVNDSGDIKFVSIAIVALRA